MRNPMHRLGSKRSFLFASASVLALAFAGCGGDDDGESVFGGDGGSSASSGSGGGSASGGTGAGGLNFGGGANSDAGGVGGGNPDGSCASTIVQSSLVPANLLFVVDRSGSMNCNLPSDGQTTAECEITPAKEFPAQPSKWELTRDALKQSLDDLEVAGNVGVGMVNFPVAPTDCTPTDTPDVAIQSLDTTQNTDLKAALDAVVPKGKTPLAGATILAYKHILGLLKAATTPANYFVVVITDGFETCQPSVIAKLLGQDIPTASGINIRTFVIGVPGSEDGRALLSQMSFLGNTALTPGCTHTATPANVGDCHFDMTTSTNLSQDLKDALAVISGQALSCELDVPAAPPGSKIDYASVKVKNTGVEVTKDDAAPCDSANGWQFSTDKKKIYLCGSACDDAKQPGVSLSIDLGCLGNIQ
jgi:hypothetical protein